MKSESLMDFLSKNYLKEKIFLVILRRILTKGIPWPKNFPPIARDFVSRLLVKEPAQRLGNRSVDEIKSHQFFDVKKHKFFHICIKIVGNFRESIGKKFLVVKLSRHTNQW